MENLMLKCLVLVALAVMFGSPLVAASLEKLKPPPGYEPVLDGPGFLKLHRDPLDWYDALVNCRLEGSTLASPLNSELTYSLLNITWGLPGTHVGVRAREGQTYFTIEGVELSKIERWANWAVVVPLGAERCMILRPDGTLKAFRCNKKHPYVCFRNITEFNREGFNECGTLDDGYKLYKSTGTCYKLHRIGIPWARAVLSCQAEGASLLIIKSKEEADVAAKIALAPTTTIKHKSKTDPPYYDERIYLGIFRASSLDFMTIHGKPYTNMKVYKEFDESVYNYHVNDLCGVYWPLTQKLYSMHCEYFFRYICEKKP